MNDLHWGELKFWESGEYQVVEERIHELEAKGLTVNPVSEVRFAALDRTPREKVKVVLLGQDPYPNPRFACGYAFSVPKNIPVAALPPTLQNILKEYHDDLGYPAPASGDLLPWADRGVLLWNSIPTCTAGRSLSHDWSEWTYLTKEIFENLEEVVVVLMGSRAKSYEKYVNESCPIVYTSHPSPQAYMHGRIPKNSFIGSRLFSTVNAKLCELGKEPIDWKLP